MDKAELYAKNFINDSKYKSIVELGNNLMYMEYLLEEVRKNVSYSEIELLLVEGIDKCKRLIDDKE